nr:MAG: replication associated protein [Cressdnaviricota sp.]
MEKTDKQTDRGFNWLVTAFNDEAWMLERMRQGETPLPLMVKELTGGLEQCPDTKKYHFQGHIWLNSQQRRSAIKKWLPTAHLEVAKNKYASIEYALKSDTAVGDKSQIKNDREYLDNEGVLRLLAQQTIEPFVPLEGPIKMDWTKMKEEHDYWERAKAILRKKPYLIGLLAKPDIYRAWKYTKEVWLEAGGGNEVITPDEPEVVLCDTEWKEV